MRQGFSIVLVVCGLFALAGTPAASAAPPAVAPGAFGSFELTWGTPGTGPGQFGVPNGVTVDASGTVYVADSGQGVVKEFDSSGTQVGELGATDLDQPLAVAVDSLGDVYVIDHGHARVAVFSSDGTFLRGIQSHDNPGGDNPTGVTVDDQGSMYVAFNLHVQKFDSQGTFIREWGPDGTANTQFVALPTWIAASRDGQLYVGTSSLSDEKVYRFDSDGGAPTATWGSKGTADGQFENTNGGAVDATGRVYVLDEDTGFVKVFEPDGTFLGKWDGTEAGDGHFGAPQGIGVNSAGQVYVSDVDYRRVDRFGPPPIAYTENDGPTAVDPQLSVSDPDSADLEGATVKIASGLGAGDELAFTPAGGITGGFSGDTLTLSGTASVAQYRSVLRSVTYRNASEDPAGGARRIEFAVSDGTSSSPAIARSVLVTPVDDAPVLQASGGSAAYTEDQVAPLIVDGGLTVADPDSAISSGQVRLASGFQAGDVLSAVSGNGIAASYDPGTGVLTLSGTATPADYEAALRSVTFSTPSQSPGSARTVQFQVSDGSLSGAATKDIAVTSVEDLPVAVDDARSVAAGAAAKTMGVLANDTDLDGGTKAVEATTKPAHGTVAIVDGDVTYKPKARYCNSRGPQRDTFKYTLNGGSQATVTVKVTCPSLRITHPEVVVQKGGALVGLLCKVGGGAQCTGTVRLLGTNRSTRFKAAAAKSVRFSIAAGKSKTVRVKVPAKSAKQLARTRTAVAQVVVQLSGGGVVKRYITLHRR